MTISLCMIVKNEESNLETCLKSVTSFVDEIIIVDTGSSDGTKSIAKKFTDKIYDFEWTDDFSAARNYSFSKATMEYIMWLDADDIILDEDVKKIIELKNNMSHDVDAVLMKYALGIDEYHHATYGFYRERIVKRSKNFEWVGKIHEIIKIYGNLLQTDICILHCPSKVQIGRNLNALEQLITSGKALTPREIYYYATELNNDGQYKKAFEYYLKLLKLDDPTPQYIPDVCLKLASCYMKEGKTDEALKVLIRSMENSIMRPEILCYIGSIYKEKMEYQKAISWYELIFTILVPKFDLELHNFELGGFVPCIDLCYCYFKLGNYDKAIKYNEMAAKYKPNDPIIQYNKDKFREAGIL